MVKKDICILTISLHLLQFILLLLDSSTIKSRLCILKRQGQFDLCFSPLFLPLDKRLWRVMVNGIDFGDRFQIMNPTYHLYILKKLLHFAVFLFFLRRVRMKIILTSKDSLVPGILYVLSMSFFMYYFIFVSFSLAKRI